MGGYFDSCVDVALLGEWRRVLEFGSVLGRLFGVYIPS